MQKRAASVQHLCKADGTLLCCFWSLCLDWEAERSERQQNVLATVCTPAGKFSCKLLMSSPMSMSPSVSLEESEEMMTEVTLLDLPSPAEHVEGSERWTLMVKCCRWTCSMSNPEEMTLKGHVEQCSAGWWTLSKCQDWSVGYWCESQVACLAAQGAIITSCWLYQFRKLLKCCL